MATAEVTSHGDILTPGVSTAAGDLSTHPGALAAPQDWQQG